MTPAEDSLIDTLTASFCREGYPYEKHDKTLLRIYFQWLWQSGQWVLISDKKTNQLLGWMSFYLTDEITLEKFGNVGFFIDSIINKVPLNLTNGNHIYIAITVVMPWAPQGTYRRLFETVQEVNSGAETISAHLMKRNGTSRYLHRNLS